MMGTRRQFLQAAAVSAAIPHLHAARKEFWQTKDPNSWSQEEKQILLWQSPWVREGFARIEEKQQTTPGYGNNGRPGVDLPDTRPGVPPGGVRSVPIGQPIPPAPKPDSGDPVQFRVLARWESAKPVRLAGGPELPEQTGQFYVIRLRGLPLMPPPKVQPGDATPPDPNEDLLQALKASARLERAHKSPIPCAHLFKGSGNESNEVLLFFPRTADAITVTDKAVTLESRFAAFHLSIKFQLKEMIYRGALAL